MLFVSRMFPRNGAKVALPSSSAGAASEFRHPRNALEFRHPRNGSMHQASYEGQSDTNHLGKSTQKSWLCGVQIPKYSRAFSTNLDVSEYRNPWSSPNQNRETFEANDTSHTDLAPLDDDPVLDRQSRFLLQLLQELHRFGGSSERIDRVTTERCHGVLQALAQAKGGKEIAFPFDVADTPVDVTGMRSLFRALRADAILRAMQKFVPLQKELDKKKVPVHTSFPVPAYETYGLVLRMYASRFVSNHQNGIPKRCREIVEDYMLASKDDATRPGIMHWNFVLSAWANCADEERPVRAAAVLKEMLERNEMDSLSFTHVLRACSTLRRKPSEKFNKLAAPVAQRVWKAQLESSDKIPIASPVISAYLRVGRNYKKSTRESDDWADRVFRDGCERGLINVHVLEELKQTASPSLIDALLPMVESRGGDYDSLKIVREIPEEWHANVVGKKYQW